MSVKSDSILHEVHGEKTIPTIYHNAMLSEIKTLTAQNQKYQEALESVYDDLMNLQPHIPEACYPNRQTFIDAHIDKAMKTLRETLKQ